MLSIPNIVVQAVVALSASVSEVSHRWNQKGNEEQKWDVETQNGSKSDLQAADLSLEVGQSYCATLRALSLHGHTLVKVVWFDRSLDDDYSRLLRCIYDIWIGLGVLGWTRHHRSIQLIGTRVLLRNWLAYCILLLGVHDRLARHRSIELRRRILL